MEKKMNKKAAVKISQKWILRDQKSEICRFLILNLFQIWVYR